ncbi:MAG: hypothetical protein ABIE22_00745 [archaeon]
MTGEKAVFLFLAAVLLILPGVMAINTDKEEIGTWNKALPVASSSACCSFCTNLKPYATFWTPGTTIYINNDFDLDYPADLVLIFAIDNDIECWMNGEYIFGYYHEGCAETMNPHKRTISKEYTQEGSNRLRCKLIDHSDGGMAYFDAVLAAEKDLSIEETIPVQVVNYGGWLEDKEGMARVKVILAGKEEENVDVKLEIYESGNLIYEDIVNADIKAEYTDSEIKQGKDTVNFFGINLPAGIYEFKSIVDPDNLLEEGDEENNLHQGTGLQVRQQHFSYGEDRDVLKIEYIPIRIKDKWGNEHPPAERDWDRYFYPEGKAVYSGYVSEAYQMMLDIFPVTSNSLPDGNMWGTEEFPKEKSRDNFAGTEEGLATELIIELEKEVKNDKTPADYYIGVVPPGWLLNREISCGYGRFQLHAFRNVILVDPSEQCGSSAVLHETGHLLGLRLAVEEYNLYPPFGLQADNGWNVRLGEDGARINIDEDRGYTRELLGVFPREKYFCIMSGDVIANQGDIWIESRDYQGLLDATTMI